MKRTVLFHGLKRSGNHAVVNWLILDQKFLFVNNIVPIEDIYSGVKALPQELSMAEVILRGRIKAGRRLNPLLLSANVLLSLEDHDPFYSPFRQDLKRPLQNIFVVRGFRNLFASRIRKYKNTKGNPRYLAYTLTDTSILGKTVTKWKKYAQLFLDSSEVPRESGSSRIGVHYESFVISETYRRLLRMQIGLMGTSELPDLERAKGGGSSFGNSEWSTEQVLSREDFLDSDERYLLDSLYDDPEVRDLDNGLSLYLQNTKRLELDT